MSTRPKLGAHVSAAGGFFTAFEHAKSIGAECIQIFGASPRQWRSEQPKPEIIEQFKKAQKESGIGPVFLHAAYLANLASPLDSTFLNSVQNLSNHLRIADSIGAAGLIFHIGSGKETESQTAMDQVVSGMKMILRNVPGNAWLIMENSAGGGKKLGSRADEIGKMLHAADHGRIRVCIDTAHAFEAGMIDEYTPEKIKNFLDDWDKEVGLGNVVALHVNDSRTLFNSHHDQHENLGKGHIGLAGFKALAKEKRLHDKAWILEVPGFKDQGTDKKNMDILKACFK